MFKKVRLSNGAILIIENEEADQEYIDALIAVAEEEIAGKKAKEEETDAGERADEYREQPRRRGRKPLNA